MQIHLDLQNNLISGELSEALEAKKVPHPETIQSWIESTLIKVNSKFNHPEITVRVVSAQESQQLNQKYRSIDSPTNVLSFPFEAPAMVSIEAIEELLGDLVICQPVVEQQANQQKKSLESHWAHMVIHGVLHLLGFDHLERQEQLVMEAIEIELLSNFGFSDPY